MIDCLPKKQPPAWLTNITPENTASLPPIKELLADSLYYPSSAFDGDPIAYLSANIYSYIYVDYGFTVNDLEENLNNKGFLGYHIIQSVDADETELVPNGWTPIQPTAQDGKPEKYEDWIKAPFAKWIVFQRNEGLDDHHGAERFSLLYLCAEAVAAFQALYVSNNSSPLAIAVIQPGHAFGGNWTNFTDPNQIFARTVLGHPYGKPKYLLYGGAGGVELYRESCWPKYTDNVCFLGNTSIGVWQ